MPLFSINSTIEFTPIPNWFIRSYMKSAPGEYVKVFLYGLLFLSEKSECSFKDFCAQLQMPCDNVVCAFEYWQQQGLIKIKNGKDISFSYLKPVLEEDSSRLYTEQEYNITVQKLFSPRVLTASDFQKIYDYTDTFRLPKEVVLTLLEYCIKMKNKDISFAYIDKIAKSWADEGVNNVNEACAKMKKFEASTSDAVHILRHIGIMDRLPTEDEMALYNKWTKEWGFSLDSIKTACGSTTSSRSPSIKYIDSILKSFYEKGLITSSRICNFKITSEPDKENIKKLMHTMGFSDLTVSPEYELIYKKWSKVFSFDVILLAAKQAARYSKKSFDYVDKVLLNWHSKGLKSVSEIEADMKEVFEINKKVDQIFKLSGIKKYAAETDRQKYIKWTREWGFHEDILHLACEISSVSQNPYKYLDKLLSIWHEKNVKTFEQASQETKNITVKPAAESKKNNAESLKYMQRNNTGKDLTFLYANLQKNVEEN